MKKIFTMEWFEAALIRCIKTMAQAALGMVTVGQVFMEINWLGVLGVAVTAGIISLLTSLVGLPELKTDGNIVVDTSNPEFDNYSLVLNEDPSTIQSQNIIRFKVVSNNETPPSQE